VLTAKRKHVQLAKKSVLFAALILVIYVQRHAIFAVKHPAAVVTSLTNSNIVFFARRIVAHLVCSNVHHVTMRFVKNA
jgi:hypothetical protein